MSKILIVEDEQNIGKTLSDHLTSEGYTIVWAQSLQEAKDNLDSDVEMIILDWMLPDGQGIDFLKALRADNILTPVIMLTARVELIDKIVGLETGANDYMTKPFEIRELTARIRVQLRTANTPNEIVSSVIHGSLEMYFDSRQTLWKDEDVVLTKMEFDLLKLLVEVPGKVFSRDEILNKVWGYDSFPTTRTVDTHVLQIRQKMDGISIDTVRGIGYRIKK
jgi:DNA-binding response OmpR family regulator